MTLKIYTKVGDQGKTKQVSGKMVPKYDLQIETLGNLDELQSYLGVVIANLRQYPRIPAFILPGGSTTAANLQYSRTLARRAERSLVELNDKKQPILPFNLEYINRLSDYLFTLARYANVLDGYQEVKSK